MNILVFGGLGYIGIPLCEALRGRGNRVTCFDNVRYDNYDDIGRLYRSNGDFKFVRGDVRDRKKVSRELAGIDVVFNLAAIVGAPACDKCPEEAVDVNEAFVHFLCEEMWSEQHLVQFTTNSGYGMTDGLSEVDENWPLNPTSLYGKTKVKAEDVAMQRERSTSLRLATVFGYAPRMRYDLLVNDWTEKLARNKKGEDYRLTIYEPHYNRNYVHVQDVVRAAIHSISIGHGVYNVGNPQANCTKWELACNICAVLGLDPSAYVSVDPNGKDVDQRNYKVNNNKLLNTGYLFQYGLTSGIEEVFRHVMGETNEAIAKGRNV